MHSILIIDDEEKLRTLLSRIIRLEGFQVLESSDLKSGWKLIERNIIDVLICDVKLPDGNGVDFVYVVKESGQFSCRGFRCLNVGFFLLKIVVFVFLGTVV